MPNASAVIFDRIFSDPILLVALEEACRSGRIRATGKRVKHILKKRRKGRYTVSEFVQPKLESIPADDFADLSLFRFGAPLWIPPRGEIEQHIGYPSPPSRDTQKKSIHFALTASSDYDQSRFFKAEDVATMESEPTGRCE